MPSERMVVLATSRKMNGRCVAGISTHTGDWVRPVSDLEHGELTRAHYGPTPDLLEIVEFEVVERLGDPAQPENVLIGRGPWKQHGALPLDDAYEWLRPHLADASMLLGNRGKAMPDEVAQVGVGESLALIEPERVRLKVEATEHGPSARVEFRLGGQRYDLGLTDFDVAPRLLKLGEGDHGFEEAGLDEPGHVLITASLAEPLDGWRYKLAAALLVLP